MTVIRSADARRIVGDALVLDLGDLVRQGDTIRRRAEEEAARIIEQGRQERQRLIEGARAEGLAQGMSEGKAAGMKQGAAQGSEAALVETRDAIGKLNTQWSAALETFVTDRERMFRDAKDEIIRLALVLAEKVTHRVVEADPAVVARQMQEVLSTLARRTRLVVQIHPVDELLLRQAMPGLLDRFPNAEHLELSLNDAIPRGSVIARTATGGSIDASLDTQLNRIVQELLPSRVVAGSATKAGDVSDAQVPDAADEGKSA
jgi:flagellar assembly protein FliH